MTKLTKEIEKVKTKLIEKVKTEGIYENFGQKEVRKLEEKYIDISKYTEEMNNKRDVISEFDQWCSHYNG